tara:strand:+ start:760 stop:1203 length:444 start_codon:yes stop_codon:yes gene_type:complete
LGETFDDKTLLSWVQGERVPRSLTCFEILSRIERRYRLGQGYFKAKLPHQSRSLHGHDMGDISAAERRRLAWHLLDNFGSLPFSKREEVIEWVRQVIISGSGELCNPGHTGCRSAALRSLPAAGQSGTCGENPQSVLGSLIVARINR